MFEQIVSRFPPDPTGTVINFVVAVGIAIGAITALIGAVHSRTTMAIMMLGIGAMLGAVVPPWLGWSADPAILIGIFAITSGLIGFLLHRWCVAFAFGALVSLVLLGVVYDQSQPLDKPTPDAVQLRQTLPESAVFAWDSAPERFKALAPWVAVLGFVAAGAVALLFPKFGMAALYSLGGTLLTLFMIKLGHASDKIHWLDSIKTGPMTTAVLGLAMLMVGFLTQMTLLYRRADRQGELSAPPKDA